MSGGSDKPVAGTSSSTGTQDSTSKSSSSQTGTATGTSQKTLPPWLEEQLKGQIQGYGQTLDQYGNAVDNWQAAGFSPDQLAGFQSMRDAVGGASFKTPLDELLATARGDYLYGGPGFDAAVQAAYRSGMPNVLSTFGRSGRDENFGGPQALSQIFADAFAGQYGQERGYQQQAARDLPQLSLLPGQTYADIGKQFQQLQQYGTNYPLETLLPQLAQMQQYTGFTDPFTGQTTAGTTAGTAQSRSKTSGTTTASGTETPAYFPGSSSPLGAILAGAGAGGQIGGPWGAAGGAALGGLLSAIG